MVGKGETYCRLLLLSSSLYSRNSAQVRYRTQARDWISKKDQLMEASPFVEKLHLGRKAKYPAIEEELILWIKENRDKARPITRNMITRKVKSLAEKDIYREMYP